MCYDRNMGKNKEKGKIDLVKIEEEVMEKLIKDHMKVTTTESCTGGLLAGTMLNVSGASTVYEEGYITYSNSAKERILGVPYEILSTYGAVSKETAAKMAAGAARAANADVALSTTGIAGPGGGTKEKPVGLIYIGCFLNGDVTVKELRLKGTRDENRKETVRQALLFLNEQLSKRK